jgi:hypothetical protein
MSKHQSSNQSSDKEVYFYQAHGPMITSGGKNWCFSCGHVMLHNTVSRWATDKGCLNDLHPSYSRMVKKAGGRRGNNS